MTTTQILQQLKEGGKPVTRATLYNYLNELTIRPVQFRLTQRPVQYPNNTAQRILDALGITKPLNGQKKGGGR